MIMPVPQIPTVTHGGLTDLIDTIDHLGDDIPDLKLNSPELKRREDIKAALNKIRQYFPELEAWVPVTNYKSDGSGLMLLFITARSLAEEAIEAAQHDLEAAEQHAPQPTPNYINNEDEKKKKEEEAAQAAELARRRMDMMDPLTTRLTPRMFQSRLAMLLKVLKRQLANPNLTLAQVFNGQAFSAYMDLNQQWAADPRFTGPSYNQMSAENQALMRYVGQQYSQHAAAQQPQQGAALDDIPFATLVEPAPGTAAAPLKGMPDSDSDESSDLHKRMMNPLKTDFRRD